MRYWHTTACALLLGGMLTPSLTARGFEPLSVRSIARHLGVGCGNGYHTRPCHPKHRAFYDGVTQGGVPMGSTEFWSSPGDVSNAGTTPPFPVTGGRVIGRDGTGAPNLKHPPVINAKRSSAAHFEQSFPQSTSSPQPPKDADWPLYFLWH